MRNRLILLGAALAAFGASLFSGFHFDDYAIFSDHVLTSATAWRAVWALRRGPFGLEPLTSLVYWLNFQAVGRSPWLFHFVSLALHIGAVLLAFECLRRLMPERAALAGALVFALHPIQAEAVNYIFAQSVLLAAALSIASLLLWVEGRRWVAVVLFALALLTDEHCAAFALVPLIVAPRERKTSYLVPLGLMISLALAALGRAAYAAWLFHPAMAPGKFLLAQGRVVWRYALLVFVPYGFSIDPDVRIPALWLGELFWLPWVSAAIWAWRFRKTDWGAWCLAGLVLLLPAASLLPAADLAADRRMYLPMFAFAAAAGLLLSRVRTQALVACVAALLACFSMVRTYVWMNDRLLWQEAAKRAPEKIRPKVQLSRYLAASDALHMLQVAQNAAPNDPTIMAEIGRILMSERQVEPALIQFGRAVMLDPGNAQYYNSRGVALGLLGEFELARRDFQHALALDPELTEAQQNLERIPPAQ